MSKNYNLRTQKGILQHCADLGHEVLRCEEAETVYIGQPATFHIGGDSYATSVIGILRYKKTGAVREVICEGGQRFVPKVSANCTSLLDGDEWKPKHRTYLDGRNTSGWLELGVAVTYLDPHF